ncbi:E3 ubiquitin-protein ligase TRIM39-like [Antennarius striatus]|uniref:E3 ubiquitin-protein ligase TRIM39-like n=1 Tax=Antennarius striatus TaxID=241820 RepID=UPI0035AF231E
MSAISCLVTKDRCLCSICLDVFTDPVTTPCGHNFCKSCVTDYWIATKKCQCPNCKKTFNKRPELEINTFISEVATQLRQSVEVKACSGGSEPQDSKPGEISCDVCVGTKKKALKTCLLCLASYCKAHLEPHLIALPLKAHQLIDPVDLENRMCTSKHNRAVELFCRTDQMCVCMFCAVLGHKSHDVVPLKDEYTEKRANLEKTETEIQTMIQERQLKILEFKSCVGYSKNNADRELTDGARFFNTLMESIKGHDTEFINKIKEKQRQTENWAEHSIQELEQEISELQKRSSEVEQLLKSEDQFQFIDRFSLMSDAPPAKDWSVISTSPPSYIDCVRAAAQKTSETVTEQIKQAYQDELKNVRQYAVDVTLDHNTADSYIKLSDDGKQANYCFTGNYRRSGILLGSVKAQQSFSSGRFYYEVQVEKKNDWGLGVIRKSTNTYNKYAKDGYWMICFDAGREYRPTGTFPVYLDPKSQHKKVGVFVDYEEGLVSFYDAEDANLIYSFTGCEFNEDIFPIFCPAVDLDTSDNWPLIICPVNHTK